MRPPVNALGQPKRERFLFMGGFKSGKTHAALTIASMHQKRHSTATFYWIDTDKALNDMLGYPPFDDLKNIVYEEPESFVEVRDVTKRFRSKIQPGDFLVIDMISPCYEWVQQEWVQEVYGEDMDVILARKVAQRMAENKLEDSAGKVNMGQEMLELISWPAIKKRYNPWAASLISHPGHVILIAGQKELFVKEKGVARQEYGGIGVKPDAQAYTGHLVNEIFWFRAPKTGEPPRINTVGIGARGGRPVLKGDQVKNFAMQILVGRYGWKL